MASERIVPDFREQFHLKVLLFFLLGVIFAVPFWPLLRPLLEQIVVATVVVFFVWFFCQQELNTPPVAAERTRSSSAMRRILPGRRKGEEKNVHLEIVRGPACSDERTCCESVQGQVAEMQVVHLSDLFLDALAASPRTISRSSSFRLSPTTLSRRLVSTDAEEPPPEGASGKSRLAHQINATDWRGRAPLLRRRLAQQVANKASGSEDNRATGPETFFRCDETFELL